MIKFKQSIFALAMLATLSSTLALAEDQSGPNLGEKGAASPQADGVSQLLLADQLATYGIQNADPVAIIQAAKIKLSVAAQETAMDKSSDAAGESGAQSEKKGEGRDLSAEALLTRAEGMATGNPTLTALIADARGSKARGATRGPSLHKDRVNANATDRYKLSFKAGETAKVAIVGDGDTDLDLYVYDSNGNEICHDTDYSDQMYCQWTPRWTGTFKIHIVNRGGVYNRYTLATN